MTKEEKRAMVEEYFPLVDKVVGTYRSRHSVQLLFRMREECMSEGYLRLLKCVESFDPERGVQFTTYASRAIQKGIYDILKDQSRLDDLTVSLDNVSEAELSNALESTTYTDKEEEDWEWVDSFKPEGEVDADIFERLILGTATQKEVGDDHGIARKTIATRYRRMKIKIKKQIEEEREANNNNNTLENN